jgi:general secretion pathway protein K
MTPPSAGPDEEELRNSQRGFVIIAVLWILAALAALDAAYSVYVSNVALASRLNDDRLESQAAIHSSLELVAYRLTSAPENARPTSGTFTFPLGRSIVGVHFVSEGARVDINAAPKDLLKGLFTSIGVDAERAAFYAERVVAWRQRWSDAAQDEEGFSYKAAGLPYYPREGPFQSVSELGLVRGIPPGVLEKILPFVTIYNGRAEIDALNAAPEVIAALPGVSTASISGVLSQRALDPSNTAAILEILGPARNRVSVDGRQATRIFTAVSLENGHRIQAEAVIILLEVGDEPYKVLYWGDDFDGPF